MNFKRPIATLERRIGCIRTGWEFLNPANSRDAKMILEDRREIEEHERAIEFLKAIIHIDTK